MSLCPKAGHSKDTARLRCVPAGTTSPGGREVGVRAQVSQSTPGDLCTQGVVTPTLLKTWGQVVAAGRGCQPTCSLPTRSHGPPRSSVGGRWGKARARSTAPLACAELYPAQPCPGIPTSWGRDGTGSARRRGAAGAATISGLLKRRGSAGTRFPPGNRPRKLKQQQMRSGEAGPGWRQTLRSKPGATHER